MGDADEQEAITYLLTGQAWMLLLSEQLSRLSRVAEGLSALATRETEEAMRSAFLVTESPIQSISDQLMTLQSTCLMSPRSTKRRESYSETPNPPPDAA